MVSQKLILIIGRRILFTGNFEGTKARSNPCKWFWEIVTDEYDQEMRARLLQFITGTSGVPSRGFSVLQGSDGNIKLFTLNGIDMRPNVFPKAHTCFNRLDLPMYKSKAMLREKSTYAKYHQLSNRLSSGVTFFVN